jgi:hypothetical protein
VALLANHAAAITVPGSGKTAVPGTSAIAFTNSGTAVLVVDTVGGERARGNDHAALRHVVDPRDGDLLVDHRHQHRRLLGVT